MTFLPIDLSQHLCFNMIQVIIYIQNNANLFPNNIVFFQNNVKWHMWCTRQNTAFSHHNSSDPKSETA